MSDEITIKIARREDGGLRVWSDDEPALILSGPDPHDVMANVWPAVEALKQYRARHPKAQSRQPTKESS